MKKFFVALFLSTTCSFGSAALPWNDLGFHPNPLHRVVNLVTDRKSFMECIKSVSDQSGVEINVDREGLQKVGITVNHNIKIVRINLEMITMVDELVRQIDPEGKLAIFLEEDGSLTITADE